jgi:hypothetical protein
MSPERLAVIFIIVVVMVAILVVLWGLFGAPSECADTFANRFTSQLSGAIAQQPSRLGEA